MEDHGKVEQTLAAILLDRRSRLNSSIDHGASST
jgi:hypothetical protein